MAEKTDHVLESIHQQFLEYYNAFLQIAEHAPELFVAGDFSKRLQEDLLRVQLYRLATDKSVRFATTALDAAAYDQKSWEILRQQFKNTYNDELATTYFTSVMRKIFRQRNISIEFEDDGITNKHFDPEEIINRFTKVSTLF